MIVVATFALKLAAYTLWCYVGLRTLRVGQRPEWMSAGLFALLRLIVGIAAGAAVMAVVMRLAPAQNRLGVSIPWFLAVLTLMRWLEWGFVGGLMARRLNASALFGGPLVWKGAGVALSYATDAAALAIVGAAGWMPC